MHPGVILAIAAVVIFRLVGPLAGPAVANALANISPLAAVIVTGAIYLPRPAAFVVPFGALFVSTLAVNAVKGWPIIDPFTLGSIAGFLLLFCLGWLARGTRRLPVVVATSVAGTLLFYLFTNTVSFFFEPSYAKTLAGWLQCVSVGLPQYPPTWMFLIKSLAGDLFFTALIILSCHPFAWRVNRSFSPAVPAVWRPL
jgi:Family of unknown function (DUF6580)